MAFVIASSFASTAFIFGARTIKGNVVLLLLMLLCFDLGVLNV